MIGPDRRDGASDALHAWFLGPRGENAELLDRLITEALRDHVFWRRNHHPEDGFTIRESDKRRAGYDEAVATLSQELMALLAELKRGVPFFSGRYVGHMNAEQTIASQIGYFAAMLYNPNNVAIEASPVTTRLELEVAAELARMIGYEPATSWGHLASGGTVANVEALWIARNIIYFPVAERGAAEALGFMPEVRLPDGDPHKLGYVPYPAGAFLVRDRRARELVATDPPYLLPSRGLESAEDLFLGRFIFEGSKPGAAATAVWLSHKVVPLDERGHGYLIERTVCGARRPHDVLGGADFAPFRVVRLPEPDINIVCYIVHHPSLDSLEALNAFNERIYERMSLSRAGASPGYIITRTRFQSPMYDGASIRYWRSWACARRRNGGPPAPPGWSCYGRR